jgi:hypothetical protein
MKQYVIDELRLDDYKKIKAFLDEHLEPSFFKDLYRLVLKEEMLTPLQSSHIECKPFYISIELEETKLSCEFLVRSENNIRCECIGYADKKQRDFFINKIDSILNELNIKI